MVEDHHEKLWVHSETLMAGIRNVMLTGKAPFAVELVNDVRHNLKSFSDLTVYDRFGREVFLREGEGVVYNVDDPYMKATLSTHKMQSTMMKDEKQQDVWTRYEPLLNRPECWRCHDPKDPVRGVLQLALQRGMFMTLHTGAAVEQMADFTGDFIAAAFRNIMVGGGGQFMDTLMTTSRDIPTISKVQVYSRLGDLAFGPEEDEIESDRILEFINKKSEERQFKWLGKKLRLFIPLKNEDRCQVCHGSKFPMRGVMVIDFHADSLKQLVRDPYKLFTPVLQAALFEGFRGIMLVGRAGSVRYYMDELRKVHVVHTIRVFDKQGNERFLNPQPRVRPQYKEVVDSLKAMEFIETQGDEERLVRLSPLPNEARCYSCHGKNHNVRAVIEVSASMKEIDATIQANKVRSAGLGALTIALVWIAIRAFTRTVVVKPVQNIESVASRVGEGDFTVQARVDSQDEIGILAQRINEMIQGLRERFHLQKFVSRQTVNAIRSADVQGLQLGGERKVATVFFSDIRGFTAYSEKVEPEKVVAMLNGCLSKQSEIVRKYGGDIDKYVGDELVAVFEGGKMVERAVGAALEIQKGLHEVTEEKDVIRIGIGINTGEMVMGAMGSAERMDYTVIGDNVNLGSRLCSVAGGGQVLLSEASAKYLDHHPEFQLTPLESIKVKGKEKPIAVYEVAWKQVGT